MRIVPVQTGRTLVVNAVLRLNTSSLLSMVFEGNLNAHAAVEVMGGSPDCGQWIRPSCDFDQASFYIPNKCLSSSLGALVGSV